MQRNIFVKLWRWVRWPLAILAVLYIALVIYRIPAVGERQRTADAIKNIQAAKISLATVMGTNLPPQPYKPENEATVAGLDKNGNGIRDDVELAIFAEYPDSAKIRAAELQYAMTEQMFLTDVFNTETWKAVAEQDDRAYQCNTALYSLPNSPKPGFYTTEVENLVRNNMTRENKFQDVLKLITSFGLPDGEVCDVDLASLPN